MQTVLPEHKMITATRVHLNECVYHLRKMLCGFANWNSGYNSQCNGAKFLHNDLACAKYVTLSNESLQFLEDKLRKFNVVTIADEDSDNEYDATTRPVGKKFGCYIHWPVYIKPNCFEAIF